MFGRATPKSRHSPSQTGLLAVLSGDWPISWSTRPSWQMMLAQILYQKGLSDWVTVCSLPLTGKIFGSGLVVELWFFLFFFLFTNFIYYLLNRKPLGGLQPLFAARPHPNTHIHFSGACVGYLPQGIVPFIFFVWPLTSAGGERKLYSGTSA